ncbi:hypothetical protein Bbelb_208790 [Branchiostoma belcheri]|nr:hypothetical protein Bbelb_208790 [Branchiostoma belcheri]
MPTVAANFYDFSRCTDIQTTPHLLPIDMYTTKTANLERKAQHIMGVPSFTTWGICTPPTTRTGMREQGHNLADMNETRHTGQIEGRTYLQHVDEDSLSSPSKTEHLIGSAQGGLWGMVQTLHAAAEERPVRTAEAVVYRSNKYPC